MNKKKFLIIGGIVLLVLAVIGGIIFASKGGLSKLVIFPKEKEKEVEAPKKKDEKKKVAERAGPASQKTVTTREIGHITQIYKKAGSDYLDIDYVQWFEGDEADKEARKDGVLGPDEEHMPDGYYVRNVNPKIRTFRISGDATVFVPGYRLGGTESTEPHKVNLETLKQFVAQQDSTDLYWITLHDNVVAKIEQQYRP